MRSKYVFIGCIAIAAAASTPVRADEWAGPYFGASIGQATDEADEFKDSGMGFKVMGGYAFNRYFAAELAYMNAGNLTDRIDGIDVKVESTGVAASMLGKLPLGDALSLFAKLGYTFYDEKVSLSLGDLRDSETNNDDDLLYGIGAELDFGKHFQVRAEYEVVDVSNADFNMVSVGATTRF